MNYTTQNEPLTPIHDCGEWTVKREDRACFHGAHLPSGAKMRQFNAMISAHPEGTPLIVGCSANSAMQIYVAAAAEKAGRASYVFTPGRKTTTLATRWAIKHGACVEFVRPGYATQYRKAARDKAAELGGCIKWDRALAIEDAARQTANIPDAARVVVPTGTGLTAIGIIVGIVRNARAWRNPVLLCTVSELADVDAIKAKASEIVGGAPLPSIEVARCAGGYEDAAEWQLPDGTTLDPWYAAKCIPVMKPGDCLWNTGCRPLEAMS